MNWRDVAGVGPRSWSFIIAYVPIATMKVHLAMAAPAGAALMLNEEHRRTHELPSSPARPVASGRPLWLDDHDLAVDAFATMIAHRWDANRGALGFSG